MIRSILFDLDGTLIDTAYDLVYALNIIRKQRGLPALPVASLRSIANLGSKALIKRALDVDETAPAFPPLREQFFSLYQEHVAHESRLFPNVEKVLSFLDEKRIPWGIVTNKPEIHTMDLLSALSLKQRAGCIICGDTLPRAKPDPMPLLHACELLEMRPDECIYVGDARTDVEASKAANIKSLVALYGYIQDNDDPLTWHADGYINDPLEIIQWLPT